MKPLMLDLFAGTGGASAPFRDAGWEVVRVELDPSFEAEIHADIREWSWHGRTPTLVWASPPCTEFAREAMPWCRTKPAWERCPCCENFWCNLHEMHAHDCKCPPIEEWETDPYSVKPPSMDLIDATDRVIRECSPDFWIIENVKGATRYLTQRYGKPLVLGPIFLWGRFPRFFRRVPWWKEKLSSRRRKERAAMPYQIGEGLRISIEEMLPLLIARDEAGGITGER